MGLLSTAGRKIRTASALSVFELSLILPVFVLLGLARLAILTLPFSRYAKHMGQQVGLLAKAQRVTPEQAKRGRSIGRIVRICARMTPWQSLCLAQAMTAATLLRLARVPYHVYFGLMTATSKTAPDPLAAHAWLRTDDYNLTGGQNVESYTVVMIFEHALKVDR